MWAIQRGVGSPKRDGQLEGNLKWPHDNNRVQSSKFQTLLEARVFWSVQRLKLCWHRSNAILGRGGVLVSLPHAPAFQRGVLRKEESDYDLGAQNRMTMTGPFFFFHTKFHYVAHSGLELTV